MLYIIHNKVGKFNNNCDPLGKNQTSLHNSDFERIFVKVYWIHNG